MPWSPNQGDDAENSLSYSGCVSTVWTKKTVFLRHQEIDRNSPILCFSFTVSFCPLELSLLIILICFCFNCFSGSLFNLGWKMPTPCCHSSLWCSWKTLQVRLDPAHPVSGAHSADPPVPTVQGYGREGARLSPLSLPRHSCSNLHPITWDCFSSCFQICPYT